MFGEGISKEGEILDLAVKLDIIKKGGSWFSYGDTRLGQGRDNVKEYLKNNPDFSAEIERQVRENADKLLPGAARRAAAKPKAVEEAPVAPAASAPSAEKAAKPAGRAANIDIAVED